MPFPNVIGGKYPQLANLGLSGICGIGKKQKNNIVDNLGCVGLSGIYLIRKDAG
jgi:hypothetical protein